MYNPQLMIFNVNDTLEPRGLTEVMREGVRACVCVRQEKHIFKYI